MPTCASAPIRSSSAISVAVVIPPAAVTRASPAARTAAATAWKSNPPIAPSFSTCVKRNPPATGASARIRSKTDAPVAVRVHRRYHAVAWEGAAEIRARRGADHDSCRAGIEPGARRVEVANATADAARCPAHHLADQPRVRALAERGVEVDDRHLPGHGELLEPGQGVAAVQHQVPAPA